MKDNKKEFLGLLCGIYMIFVMAVLPLYTGGGYYMIGDNKYYMFQNVSLFCLGVWLAAEIFFAIYYFIEQRMWRSVGKMRIKEHISLSAVDYLMLAYSVFNLLSLCLSKYRNTAFFGYRDWYMGAMSQLIFVGIYFFVSRRYDGKAYPIYSAEAALFIVIIIGFANRLGMDPLSMYIGYSVNDWEYSHMLSTVGNINWLCSYIADAVPICIAGYLYCCCASKNSGRAVKRWILFAINALAIAFLFMHGSDAGMFLAAACIGLCLLSGRLKEYKRHFNIFFKQGLLLAGAAMFTVAVIGTVIVLRGDVKATPNDSIIQGLLGEPVWWAVSAFFFAAYFAYCCGNEKGKRIIRALLLIIAAATGLLVIYWYIVRLFKSDIYAYSSGRADIWLAALEGFARAPIWQKITGAGADCFAEYIYSLTDIALPEVTEGYWEGAIFANAHNEWLTQLINTGIAGTAAYAGIFISAAVRYKGIFAGLLVIILYFINSTVSFQQVMNAPMFFMLLGICESRVRSRAE